jgi:hypothetical protein
MSWKYWSNKKSEPKLFDLFTNGLGGFSFRKLKNGYTGRWGRAINIVTSVQRDIGFVNDYCDTADILDLSNGTDTVELIAYDNSFISIYFTPDPDTVTPRRPILVSSGTLVTLGGLAAADFPAIRRIIMSTSNVAQVDFAPVSIYSLAKIDTNRQRNISVGIQGTLNFGYFHDGTLTSYDGMGVNDTSSIISSLSDGDTNRRLGSYHWSGTDLKIGSNGGSLTTFAGRSGAFNIRNIGCASIATNQSFSGKIQEMLFFSSNKESDDAAIRADINSFYSVY